MDQFLSSNYFLKKPGVTNISTTNVVMTSAYLGTMCPFLGAAPLKM